MILETYNGRTDEIVYIDEADYELVKSYRWGILRQKRDGYTHKYAYASLPNDKQDLTYTTRVYLHRILAQPAEGLVVDHIDGDGLNNRRSNLRVATRSQNKLNIHNYNRVTNNGEVKEKRDRKYYEKKSPYWQQTNAIQ